MQKFDPITGAPITPMNDAAMSAGGSKPMAAMDDPYQTGQANMNPNFIGNYNGPTTGMLAQEKVENQMEKERRSAGLINSGFAKQIEAVKGANYTPSNNPEENYDKGFEPFGRTSGQAKSIDSRKIDGVTVLGGNQPTKQSGLGAIVKVGQDKAMPKGKAGKGIRGLAPSVQENMGYDPLSQERLTQSRRGTKCMRVKRK